MGFKGDLYAFGWERDCKWWEGEMVASDMRNILGTGRISTKCH